MDIIFILNLAAIHNPLVLNERLIVIDDNNLIYIAESGNRCLSVFTTDGQLVRSFGEYGSSVSQFNDPYGITFDREGYLYICDRSNNRLVVY